MRKTLAALGFFLFMPACGRRDPPPPPSAHRLEEAVAPGVVYRYFPAGDVLSAKAPVYVLEVDLTSSNIRLSVAAENVEKQGRAVFADAYTVPQWCDRIHALAGVNGGFFGGTSGNRKEIVGLLATNGRIQSSGSLYQSPKARDRKFVRCAFALDGSGVPHIGWMTGRRGEPATLADHDRPLNPASSKTYKATAAVACGPRLIENCALRITDADEKLGSSPAVPRTFVAFDREKGRPRRLVLCVSPAMTYSDAATFLIAYYRDSVKTTCAEAMCLDGGSSSQMTYRTPAGPVEAYRSPVTVPTALLVVKR